jgi:aspartate racemase
MKYVGRLQAAGCDAIATTSMAGHFCIEQLIEASPFPVINAIPAINDYFGKKGIGCVGLLGTNGVMKSKLYGGITSAEVIVPQEEVFENVSEEYFALARTGICTDEQRAFFFDIGQEMINRGADAVMLAGTDLCLAFDGQDPGFPVVDAALVHVDAIFEVSVVH